MEKMNKGNMIESNCGVKGVTVIEGSGNASQEANSCGLSDDKEEVSDLVGRAC